MTQEQIYPAIRRDTVFLGIASLFVAYDKDLPAWLAWLVLCIFVVFGLLAALTAAKLAARRS